MDSKPLKTAEEQLREKLEGEGWRVYHKGWPDFACIKPGGEMIFVEVKAYRGEMLKREQHIILTNLAKQGLMCYKWTPDGEFEQISAEIPLIATTHPKGRDKHDKRRLSRESRLARYSPSEQIDILKREADGEIFWW